VTANPLSEKARAHSSRVVKRNAKSLLKKGAVSRRMPSTVLPSIRREGPGSRNASEALEGVYRKILPLGFNTLNTSQR
jgi:hypothetical protein